jgi:hypothetical protein
MVKILSNGDIVADDDPRAQQSSSRSSGSSARPRQVCILKLKHIMNVNS